MRDHGVSHPSCLVLITLICRSVEAAQEGGAACWSARLASCLVIPLFVAMIRCDTHTRVTSSHTTCSHHSGSRKSWQGRASTAVLLEQQSQQGRALVSLIPPARNSKVHAGGGGICRTGHMILAGGSGCVGRTSHGMNIVRGV